MMLVREPEKKRLSGTLRCRLVVNKMDCTRVGREGVDSVRRFKKDCCEQDGNSKDHKRQGVMHI